MAPIPHHVGVSSSSHVVQHRKTTALNRDKGLIRQERIQRRLPLGVKFLRFLGRRVRLDRLEQSTPKYLPGLIVLQSQTRG
jgi:hypothetical protein